jgi:hypothetical protein
MALITTPLRAFKAGRSARTKGLLIHEFPVMPPEFNDSFMNGWQLQNSLILNSTQETDFLARDVEHIDLCSDELNLAHQRGCYLKLSKRSLATLDRMRDVTGLTLHQCVNLAADLLYGVPDRMQEVSR